MQQPKKLIPTENEVKTWLISTLQHSCRVEYFLGKLNIGSKDPERPHDIVGPWNKYEWEIVKGLALQYRDPEPDFETYLKPARELHRQQYHHKMWNDPGPNDKTKPTFSASGDDMLLGAVDAVCSLLENRNYQGGSHGYEDVVRIIENNSLHKAHWVRRIIPRMKSLQQPSIEQITSLSGFPNIGLKKVVYDAIVKRTDEAVISLRKNQGYSLV